MRLLPKHTDVGWTPYAWLIYLAPLFLAPLPRPAAWELPLAGLVVLIFVVLYFRVFWLTGRDQVLLTCGIALLAVLYTPINPGGSSLFIYAGAFFGMTLRRGAAVRAILALLAVIALEAWLIPLSIVSWLPAVIFTPLIGMINNHFHESSRDNARLKLAQDEVERLAKLDERERIARDLHDLLGHTLSVVTLKSELAERLLDQAGVDDPATEQLERVRDEIRDIQDLSRKAMAEVRTSISGYRTHSLQSELAKARMALAAAQVHVEIISTPYSLDPDRETVAALALREAVTNVVRHSGALACSITLRTGTMPNPTSSDARSCFELIVEDDGRGLRDEEGSGILGMRERVGGLGGTVDLIDRGGRPFRGGCRLHVRLPMGKGTDLVTHDPAPARAAGG